MPVTGNNQISYSLSIRITADGFSFFVTEAYSGDLLHREDYPAKGADLLLQTLTKAIIRPTITRQEFNQVRVVIDSDSTCIPMDEFRQEDLDALYKQVFSQSDVAQNKVCHTVIEQLGVVEAFTVPQKVYDLVMEHFPTAIITNSYATVMQRVASFCQRRNPASQPLFAYVQNDQLFIFSIFADALLFANSFTIEKEQNALFFLLSVWKELGLDVRENYCFIGGDPTPTQRLIEEARNYLLHVEQMNSVDLEHL